MIHPIMLTVLTCVSAMQNDTSALQSPEHSWGEAPKTSLTVQPLSLLSNAVAAGVETALSDKLSVACNLTLALWHYSDDYSTDSSPYQNTGTTVGGKVEI